MLNAGSWLLEDAYIMVNNTDSVDFPIRKLQVRVPLPPEEEPPKDRMDPGLQEVRSFTLDQEFLADVRPLSSDTRTSHLPLRQSYSLG
jgi:hypothetical protein